MASRYQWDDFVLDLDSYRLERAGVPLSLEPKAFNLLVLMIQRPGHLFTKQEIFEALWPDTAVTDHALTRVVAQLRRVLGDEAREARYLETVPTRGYRWIKEPHDPPKRPQESSGAKADHSDSTVAAKADHSFPRVLPGISAAFAIGLVALSFLVWAQRNQTTSASVEDPVRAGDPKWPVQVTTHSGLDMHPAMSPQGDAIAFVSDRSGSFEIYVRGLNGAAGELPLTGDGAQNMQPAWSPDGRFIAYHANKNGGIWVIPARGGTPRQVSSIGARPAWSPDGTRIAFQTDEFGDIAPNGYSAQVDSTIWIVNADGTHARALTTKPIGGHAAPAWSHNGRFIAFTVFDAGPDNGVWMASVETGATWPLELRSSLYDPIFLKDDSAVVAGGAEALIIRLPIDARTGKLSAPHQVIPVAGVPGVRGLSLSADGRRLAFAGMSLESQIWSLDVHVDGSAIGEPRQVTRDTSRRNSLAVISPDGKKVAYMSIRQGELPNVWVMNVDGSNPIQLTSDETAEHKPHWFPDSVRVGYLTKRQRAGGLWSVDINTRREQLVFDFAGAESYPNLDGTLAEFEASPSMTQIALSILTAPGQRLLYVSPIDAFRPRRIGPPGIGYPAWSPDEKLIAVEIRDGTSTHAGVVDAAAGSMRQLTRERGHTWIRSWSPDGSRVAAAAMRDGRWSVTSIDVTTGKEVAWTRPYPPGVYVRYPEWSPKGDRVLFERGVTRGNIWTIEIE